MSLLQEQLESACKSIKKEIGVGKVANYIPALAKVPADKFGAAIVTICLLYTSPSPRDRG